jgi:hypothetical protein
VSKSTSKVLHRIDVRIQLNMLSIDSCTKSYKTSGCNLHSFLVEIIKNASHDVKYAKSFIELNQEYDLIHLLG